MWKSGEVYRLVSLLQKEGQGAFEILDALPFAIAVVHSDGQLRSANRKYSMLLGAEALVRDRQLRRVVLEVVEGKSARQDVRIGSERASLMPFGDDSALVVIDSRDAATGIVDMLHALDTPAYLIADDGSVRAVNNGLAKLTGREASDLIGSIASELHAPGEIDTPARSGVRQAMIRTASGEFLAVTLKVSQLSGHLASWTLITLTDPAAKARPAEDEVMSALEFFSGRMAHFMNNWLMVAMSATDSLQKQFGSIEALRTDLEFISDSTRRAADVSRDLLAFSACRPGMLVLQTVDEVLTGMEPLLRSLAGSRRLTMEPGSLNAKIRMGVADLETVIAKLVQNAVDATPADGEITIASTRLTPDYLLHEGMLAEYGVPISPHVRVRVTDNGRGIPAESLTSIVQPFVTTKPGAAGLGLSAVHGIVKRAKGVVVFASELGRGATFDIVIPESQV